MAAMKTPGVYIVEKDAFPNSVVQVETAVPVFIGYTEMAVNGNRSLAGKPWLVSSMAEFETYFGGAPGSVFSLTTTQPTLRDAVYPGGTQRDPADLRLGDKDYWLAPATKPYLLHAAISLFYKNGGGRCYIVSVGTYADKEIDGAKLAAPLIPLEKEQEPTLVVIPEAVRLANQDCISLQQAVLNHCCKMKNRFAVLDLWDGWHVRVRCRCYRQLCDGRDRWHSRNLRHGKL